MIFTERRLATAVLPVFKRAQSLATTGLYEELQELAVAEGTTIEIVLSRDRRAPAVRGRRAVVRRLLDEGYLPQRIAGWLGVDRTSVVYLAGRLAARGNS